MEDGDGRVEMVEYGEWCVESGDGMAEWGMGMIEWGVEMVEMVEWRIENRE